MQDVAAQPDPRAAAKKAKVEALWAQLNGSRSGAASAAASAGRTGTPGATELCIDAEASVSAAPASQTAGGGFSLAALCRPLAKRSALEDKDRVRFPSPAAFLVGKKWLTHGVESGRVWGLGFSLAAPFRFSLAAKTRAGCAVCHPPAVIILSAYVAWRCRAGHSHELSTHLPYPTPKSCVRLLMIY